MMMQLTNLYAITNPKTAPNGDVVLQAQWLLESGIKTLQYRDKSASDEDFFSCAKTIQDLCTKHNCTYIINDRIPVALALAPHGLHLGQSDLKHLSPDVITALREKNIALGISIRTIKEAQSAQEMNASYLGFGAVFPTITKPESTALGIQKLSEITRAIGLPVVAIGGINQANAQSCFDAGAKSIAVISAICKPTKAETQTAINALTLSISNP